MPRKKNPDKHTKGWTPERRAAQAERCRANKPSAHSTGPKTPEGKAKSSRNAFKHGRRMRVFDRGRYLLWLNAEFVRVSMGFLSELSTNELKDRQVKHLKTKARTPYPPAHFPNEVKD